jgi:lipopolysaccharide transport system permease protein
MFALRFVDPRAHVAAWREFSLLVRRDWELIAELTRRELTSQHANQFFGPLWMVVRPMFVASLYIFLFTVVFRARAQIPGEPSFDHAAFILAGILPWLAFQTSMNVSCGLIVGNSALLKDFIFRIELLPVRSVLQATVCQVLGTLLLLAYVIIVQRHVHASWLLFPILLLLQILAMIGVGFLLAALTVVVRDLQEVVQLFSMLGIFFTPIVYRPEWVPEAFHPVLYANPFSYMVWCYHDALVYGELTNPLAWVVFPVLSLLSLSAGYRVFRYMKPHFGNFV